MMCNKERASPTAEKNIYAKSADAEEDFSTIYSDVALFFDEDS